MINKLKDFMRHLNKINRYPLPFTKPHNRMKNIAQHAMSEDKGVQLIGSVLSLYLTTTC